ncbi:MULTISPECIES: hypothetical protein [unclassified Mesorhizobium]|uniref:hypothetical protein n=1 Tax=unclassified Mesorhizobium TaxID=325217 RepID=UPI0013DE883F|nr:MULTISPECIES: hypothetical protein [unclassified Mesorhizobium]
MARSSVRSTRRAEASTSPEAEGFPPRPIFQRKQGIEDGVAVRRFSKVAGVPQTFGNDDVLVTAEKDEGHAAAHQLVCDRKHPPPIEIDVEDRGLSRLGMHGRMFDFRRRAEDDRAHIAEIS